VVHEGLSPLLLGLAVLCALFIVVNLFTAPRHAVVPIAAHHSALVLVSLVLWLAVRRGAVRESLANPVVALCGALVLSIVLHSLLVLRDPFHTMYALMLIIGFGCVFLSWGWLLASILVTAAGWALVTWPLLPAGAAHSYVLSVVVATALSLIIHVGRMRTYRRIENMHSSDRRLNVELGQALERAQTELDERHRAEREREQLAERLRHSRKMEAVGTMAGGVAHELNNVLGVITGLASVLKRESTSGDSIPDLDKILDAARRGGAFTRSLLGFVRKETCRRERFSLNEVVQDVVEILERTVTEDTEIEIETELSPQLPQVRGDPHQMTEAVMNLCLNSVQAMPRGGTITLSTAESATSGVQLTVTDDGTGMLSETLERAFEPFFTTKPPGKGTGLGLSLVYGTVKGHRGEVDIDSKPGEGTRVVLTLPAAGAVDTANQDRLESGTAEPGHGTLLMVDDDEMIRAMSRRVLETLGYRVLLAENGAEALDVYSAHGGSVDLVILDLAMPVMDGFDCFHRLKELNPSVRILLSSGYAMESKTRELLAAGARGFLKKPYDQDEFGHAIIEALS
jgi:signal transduction histidine kinase